jgi:hypothetical protein
MLHFRTILLWLAFVLLVSQYFITFEHYLFAIIFRLVPSGILLLWFFLSVFIKDRIKINPGNISKFNLLLIRVLRPLASMTIVLGAIFKISHWPYGNLLLITGIGFMALYSTLLSRIYIRKDDYNPDIVDDLED